MGVFSPKEDEVLALSVGNFLLLAGFFVIVATEYWGLGLIPALIGIYVLVVAFKEYRWGPLTELVKGQITLIQSAEKESR